ncbi:MAG: glycosyltransferase family 1 protein [Elusimicrobia bacterium]|nr:glycosyltransferase family 1 protein [Elusimicrobiota bacterium]
MRVAIDCREFCEGRMTGIGRFLSGFIAYAARERKGWEFLLLGSQDTVFPDLTEKNLRTLVIRETNTRFWDQVLLPAALRREKCDLYFSPYNKTCFFSAVPSIITIHDLIGLIYPGYRERSLLRRLLARLYALKASAILTVSENSRKDIAGILGIERERIFVCVNGIDGEIFYRRAECGRVKEKYGIVKPYVLYVGNSSPHKNVEGLLKAWSLLDTDIREEHSLVLAGVGGYRLPSKVQGVVIGHVPDQDLPFLYSGAELFVFPSFYEGFGIPPVEAMACGCPVAASNTSCLPEILGDACSYFDPARPEDISGTISSALRDRARREELARKGLERARLFTPALQAAEIMRVMETVAAGRARASGAAAGRAR